MAPEQARGASPTPATDVYGVGVVLYEMLAGRPPFVDRTAVELALRHLGDPPPPLPAGTPPALARVVDRALAKDPHDRYPSAFEMADALGETRSTLAGAPQVAAPLAGKAIREAAAGPAPTRVAPRRGPRRNVNPAEARRYRALLVLVLLILGGMIGVAIASSGGSARVPSLRGLHRADVRARLHRLDLGVSFHKRYASAPAGTVIAQAPAAGHRLSDGGVVRVVMSAGPRPIPVPQLVGQRARDAQEILARLGLGASLSQVPAPGVTPGLVVEQSPTADRPTAPHSRVRLSVAEVPRWRPLTSFSGAGAGTSAPFQIRGTRWRIVSSMGYNGVCTFIFFCSGPSATVTNALTGAKVSQFDLNDSDRATRIFSAGAGTYRIAVKPGSDDAHWAIQVQDDY
jgi:serine/threonine-protein kinase